MCKICCYDNKEALYNNEFKTETETRSFQLISANNLTEITSNSYHYLYIYIYIYQCFK